MRRYWITLLLLLSSGNSESIMICGKYSGKLTSYTRNNYIYVSTSELASAFGGTHFFVHQKAKEVLKILGHEFVFTIANPYIIVDGSPYNLKLTPFKENENFLIPLEAFLGVLAKVEDLEIKLANDSLKIGEKSGIRDDDPEDLAKTPQRKNEPSPTKPQSPPTNENEFIVVIDPGHGGKDPGAIGKNKTKEKDITLDIARRVKTILTSKGIKTYMTRETDRFIPLGERVKIANQKKASVFLSIHCNGSKNTGRKGSETFFLAPAKTNEAREAASLENASLLLEDNPPAKNLNDIESIIADLLHNEFLKESNELAGFIQKSLAAKTSLKNNGVSQAGFYVLVGAFMPAVLVETAFITNPGEEKLLASPTFRQKCASAIADGILEFKKHFHQTGTPHGK